MTAAPATAYDERRPDEGRRIVEQTGEVIASLRRDRWHVTADALLVVGRTGRTRYLLTYRCRCGARHVSYARALVEATRRTTACGQRVVLHPVARLR